MVTRKAVSLAEIAVAVALFAMIGLSLFSALSGGATAAARASELQLACTLGARVVDRMLASGFRSLAPYAGTNGDVDLTTVAGPDHGPAQVPGSLVVDGLVYRARYDLRRSAEGLLELVLIVSWQRPGVTATRQDGTLTLIRLVADPHAADQIREAFIP